MEVFKFVLNDQKTIYLREPKIDDTEKSAQIAGKKAGGDNQAYMAILLQKEMLKLLLVQVNETRLTLTDKEQLDKFLNFREYNQATKALQMVMGDDSGNVLTPEFTTIGG